jgi:hypothetical protein
MRIFNPAEPSEGDSRLWVRGPGETHFFRRVEAHLRLRHVPFDKQELAEFLRSVWPLVEADDPPARWAEAFLVALAGREGESDGRADRPGVIKPEPCPRGRTGESGIRIG